MTGRAGVREGSCPSVQKGRADVREGRYPGGQVSVYRYAQQINMILLSLRDIRCNTTA